MKILVFCIPRSRSSFLCSALSNHHNIKNNHELFNFYAKQVELQRRYGLLKKEIQIEDVSKYIKKHLNDVNNFLHTQNDYVVKLFPRELIFTQDVVYNESSFNYEIYFNFNEIFKIQNYDKIYFLNRNVIESAISYGYGFHTDNWLFTNLVDHNYVRKNLKKIQLSEKDISYMSYHIFECVVHEKIKKFLDNKNINYTYLNYNECPNYVTNNLPSDTPNQFLHGNLNYKELIEKYDDIVLHIDNQYRKFSQQLSTLEFVG